MVYRIRHGFDDDVWIALPGQRARLLRQGEVVTLSGAQTAQLGDRMALLECVDPPKVDLPEPPPRKRKRTK